MGLFSGYLVLNLFRCCLYTYEILLWSNFKIDPTAVRVKRRTFAKVFCILTEVGLFLMILTT